MSAGLISSHILMMREVGSEIFTWSAYVTHHKEEVIYDLWQMYSESHPSHPPWWDGLPIPPFLVPVNVWGLIKVGRRTVHSCYAVYRTSITIVGHRQFLVFVEYVEYSPVLCLPSSHGCQIYVIYLWLHLPATLDGQLQHFVSHQPTVNFSIGKLLLLDFSYLAVIFNSCSSSVSLFNTS